MGNDTVKLTIDGQAISAAPGTSVLDAALDHGIYIPHLCSHESLKPAGACRMCVVKIAGVDGVVTSCSTKVQEGMVVDTHDELAEKVRRLVCDFLFKTHPNECTGCPKYGKCQLQSILQAVGDTGRRLRSRPIRIPADTGNPIMLHEMVRCILCGRCVRACNELRGVGAIQFAKIDGRVQVKVDGENLAHANCRFCTACVEVCPTGAIREHPEIADRAIGKTRDAALVPCRDGCPAHMDVPRYIRFIKEGNYGAATAVVREKAPFPHSLGFVCTHPCELECKRLYLNEPISIRNLKRYAAEHDDGSWKQHSLIKPDTGKKVAVIGAGPAGLTAAYYLRKCGHAVKVFEKMPGSGGMMRYGIPSHRLPRDIVDAEVGEITAIGVEIVYDSPVESAATLKKDYDAVVAAVGTHKGVKLPVPGNDLDGVLVNAEFLRQAALNEPQAVGRRVVILGGGNVALDCAGVAKRLGAEEVHVCCLESYDAMTSTDEERAWALEEGVQLHNSKTFQEICGEDGRVSGMAIAGVRSFHFEADGRSVIELEPDSEEVIPCDTVIFAVGQRPDIPEDFGLALNRGRIAVDDTLRTDVDGVFAAGDAVYGTASVIKAIAAGRLAAEQVDRYLGGEGNIDEALAPEQHRCPYIGTIEDFASLPREEASVVPAAERVQSFCTMDLGLDEQGAHAEACRCLQCDLRLDIAPQRFWSSFTGGEGGDNA